MPFGNVGSSRIKPKQIATGCPQAQAPISDLSGPHWMTWFPHVPTKCFVHQGQAMISDSGCYKLGREELWGPSATIGTPTTKWVHTYNGYKMKLEYLYHGQNKSLQKAFGAQRDQFYTNHYKMVPRNTTTKRGLQNLFRK